ncbi:DUF4129 domain-containing protein [Aestuariimicrobium soli]|uniref:DUF4129 domain-containing protein n=1 Tax=Aestuariimicrobium soli TaxID=2035834 RepID=UPI003EBEAA1A
MLPLLEIPLRPSPDEARRWLADELGRSGYQRPVSWLERWLRDLWRRILDASVPDRLPSPNNVFVTVIVVAVLAGVVWFVWRSRPEARRSRREAGGSALVDATLSAADYRSRTTALLGSGEYDQALISAYRAIVADMVRRTVLGRRPGDTAQEVALRVSEVFGDHAQAMHRAADLFDRAAYRERVAEGLAQASVPPTTAADVAFVQQLDDQLQAARPQHRTATAEVGR